MNQNEERGFAFVADGQTVRDSPAKSTRVRARCCCFQPLVLFLSAAVHARCDQSARIPAGVALLCGEVPASIVRFAGVVDFLGAFSVIYHVDEDDEEGKANDVGDGDHPGSPGPALGEKSRAGAAATHAPG